MKKRINISIDDQVLDRLDELARSRGVDRSTMIAILISYLETFESLIEFLKNK